MNERILNDAGVNYSRGLTRFLDNREVYERILIMFSNDDKLPKLIAAFENNDYQALFQLSHAIKGVSGNLDIEDLYQKSCVLTDLLRDDTTIDKEKIREAFFDVKEEYIRATKGIKRAIEQN